MMVLYKFLFSLILYKFLFPLNFSLHSLSFAIHNVFDMLEISHNEANESIVVKLAICGILIIGLKLLFNKM